VVVVILPRRIFGSIVFVRALPAAILRFLAPPSRLLHILLPRLLPPEVYELDVVEVEEEEWVSKVMAEADMVDMAPEGLMLGFLGRLLGVGGCFEEGVEGVRGVAGATLPWGVFLGGGGGRLRRRPRESSREETDGATLPATDGSRGLVVVVVD